MTTIRRPPRRRQQTPRWVVFGASIVTLIILHLLAVAFLYQRVPSSESPALRSGAGNLGNALKQSRDSLKKTGSDIQQQQRQKHQESIEKARPQESEKQKKKLNHNADNARDKKKGAKTRPQVDSARDEKVQDKKSPKQEEKEKDQVVEEKVVVSEVQQDKKEAAIDHPEEMGTRVTDKAYISDFSFDRQHPHFRMHELVFPELDSRLESLESCGYISQHRLLTHAACRHDDTLLTVHNSLLFPRYWCGKEIAPNAVERFEEPCHEPVRVFPKNAPANGEDMEPIKITATKGRTTLETVECDIPCQQEKEIEGDTRYIEGTDWKITTTTRDVKIDGNAFRHNLYYSTPSFSSDVPLSPFSFDDYDFKIDAVKFDDTLPSASYLIDSECNSFGSKRHRWAGAVEKHFPVAFYGSCTHNTDLPDGMSLKNKDDRVKLHRKHRFNLAFEATNEKDYITEVIFDAFQSGSLPVILGPANIEDHFPPNSFINAGRFQYWDQLGQYVKEVAENKTLWESYHTWRKDPNALDDFGRRFSFTKTDSTCRMCRWAYAKRYGLGWDHVQQVVQETALPRELCLDSELATKPFVESYVTKSEDSYQDIAIGVHDSDSCVTNKAALHAAFDLNGFQVERTIEAHDGVTDLLMNHIGRPSTADGGDLILRLEFGLKNMGGASFPNPHTLVSTIRGPLCSSIAIQDERSRVTVLANWETVMHSTAEGAIEVVINSDSEGSLQEDETRRFRVIVEDMNSIHDKMTEYFPSSYGKLMILDFVDPLELYYNTN